MITETFTPKTISNEQLSRLHKFCETAYNLQEPASKNYDVNDWQNKKHTLFYLFHIKKRFEIFNTVLLNTGESIAMSGTYVYNDIPIIGVRAFTHPNYRGGGHWCQARHIFPIQIDHWDKKGYKKVWLTFNEYNYKLVNFLKRMSEGRASTFGGPREIYQNLVWKNDLIEIQYTNQIVAELDISLYKDMHSS